jgi:hypothetical protein
MRTAQTMPMKRLVAVALLVLAGIVSFACWRRPVSYSADISRLSGVTLPEGAKQVTADELDWCLVAKFALTPERAEAFRKAHPFGSFTDLDQDSPMKIDSLTRSLDRSRPDFRAGKGIVAFRGHNKTNAWEFVLEPTSSSLWVVVEFPDHSGDLPGACSEP